MNAIELLNSLVKHAKTFKDDGENITRNSHMHDSNGVTKTDVDAVLVCFINHIASKQCIDYALYAADLNMNINHSQSSPSPSE